MYSLATLGMAPRCFAELNKNGMPKNAVLISIVSCWFIILLYSFDASATVYTYLLALSGFTGAIAWISICWSQYCFRKQAVADGTFAALKYKTPLFPYVTLFGIWAQVFCLVVLAFEPDLRESLLVGVPFLVVPMAVYRVRQWKLRRALVSSN